MEFQDRLYLELRLWNYRRNRQACAPDERPAFDELIRRAEQELTPTPQQSMRAASSTNR